MRIRSVLLCAATALVLPLVTVAVANADQARAANVHLAFAGKRYDFTSTTCAYTGRGPQLTAAASDGTALTLRGPSSQLTVRGGSLKLDALVEESQVSADSKVYWLAGRQGDVNHPVRPNAPRYQLTVFCG